MTVLTVTRPGGRGYLADDPGRFAVGAAPDDEQGLGASSGATMMSILPSLATWKTSRPGPRRPRPPPGHRHPGLDDFHGHLGLAGDFI